MEERYYDLPSNEERYNNGGAATYTSIMEELLYMEGGRREDLSACVLVGVKAEEQGSACLREAEEQGSACLREAEEQGSACLREAEEQNPSMEASIQWRNGLGRGRCAFLEVKEERIGMDKPGDLERDDRNGNGNESYVPFNVENEGNGNRSIQDSDSKTEISPANVLKTLFFICVWYTFSLFLTLYNKSLLGDHMGKFPAPLLMNTFHFAMQAVLSRAITYI
uniref:Sugar phosphate transporter domain-containing protein n=1 Tax=Chenopodium quinoa TaxID=63459 RepID=A0A803M6C0_CHEQI